MSEKADKSVSNLTTINLSMALIGSKQGELDEISIENSNRITKM